MLQQILKDMYIDPDVLEALNEEQKKTLFLKMRQEQVRRWKEREDKLEREGGAGLKPKHTKATRKSVSWLLGRDGDVQVCVIGEVDEVRSSKFIYSELGQVKVSSPQSDTRNQSSTIKSSLVKRPCPENEKVPSQSPGIQLQFKAPQSEQHSAPPEDPEEEEDDDDSSVWESGLLYRPHLRQDSIKSISARLRPLSTLRTELSSADILRPREAHRQSQAGKDIQPVPAIQREGTEGDGPILEGCIARGRVAELMKAFSKPIPKQDTLSRPRKPPIPSKPAHLLFASPNHR